MQCIKHTGAVRKSHIDLKKYFVEKGYKATGRLGVI